jgi:hypothetical protein
VDVIRIGEVDAPLRAHYEEPAFGLNDRHGTTIRFVKERQHRQDDRIENPLQRPEQDHRDRGGESEPAVAHPTREI